MTEKCIYKHCLFQVPDEYWRCPKCNSTSEEGFYIYEGPNDFDIGNDCNLHHDEDLIICEHCGYETTGKKFSKLIMKEQNKVVCQCCKGKGWIDGDKKTVLC